MSRLKRQLLKLCQILEKYLYIDIAYYPFYNKDPEESFIVQLCGVQSITRVWSTEAR